MCPIRRPPVWKVGSFLLNIGSLDRWWVQVLTRTLVPGKSCRSLVGEKVEYIPICLYFDDQVTVFTEIYMCFRELGYHELNVLG